MPYDTGMERPRTKNRGKLARPFAFAVTAERYRAAD
jgi:hypothetical protein